MLEITQGDATKMLPALHLYRPPLFHFLICTIHHLLLPLNMPRFFEKKTHKNGKEKEKKKELRKVRKEQTNKKNKFELRQPKYTNPSLHKIYNIEI